MNGAIAAVPPGEPEAALAALQHLIAASLRAEKALEAGDTDGFGAALDERDRLQAPVDAALRALATSAPAGDPDALDAVRELAAEALLRERSLEQRVLEKRDQLASELAHLRAGAEASAAYAAPSQARAERFETVG